MQIADSLAEEAQQAYRTGNFDLAERKLAESLTHPTDTGARRRRLPSLARLQAHLGDLHAAEQTFSAAVEIAPADTGLIVEHAKTLNALGRHSDALARLYKLPASVRATFDVLSLTADTARKARQWSQAAETARKALAVNPNSRNMKIVLAAALARQGDWERAEPLFDALKDNAPAMEMRAGALTGAGRTQEAERCLIDALERHPFDPGLHNALAMIRWMAGETDTFADTLLQALKTRPADAGLAMTAADLLSRAEQKEDALAIIRTLARYQSAPQIDAAMAQLESDTGAHEAASQRIEKAVAAAPRLDPLRRSAAGILLRAGHAEAALSHTLWGRERDRFDQEWIALHTTAQRASGDEDWRELYDFQNFVRTFELKPPEGFETTEQFIVALAERLRELHSFSSHPLDQSLRGGSQLELDPSLPQDPLIKAAMDGFLDCAARYMAAIGNSPDHPFTARNTGKVKMSGCWSVRLRSGGSHVNHIHPEGWISSAFYVAVPPSVKAGSNTRDGWLTFGDPRFPVPGLQAEHFVKPEEGKLALFPSYMWHGVQPFQDEAERITIAFDLVPS
ncbi:putative 2OG-Fe(II) oxygenase [Henriciella sp. AS95]|uniref:putative 2OG-Fe(II) oxygenase n=1 Tax=Henriciella sp. AS95 TaxID=3135782 RepID=UPI00317F1BB4